MTDETRAAHAAFCNALDNHNKRVRHDLLREVRRSALKAAEGAQQVDLSDDGPWTAYELGLNTFAESLERRATEYKVPYSAPSIMDVYIRLINEARRTAKGGVEGVPELASLGNIALRMLETLEENIGMSLPAAVEEHRQQGVTATETASEVLIYLGRLVEEDIARQAEGAKSAREQALAKVKAAQETMGKLQETIAASRKTQEEQADAAFEAHMERLFRWVGGKLGVAEDASLADVLTGIDERLKPKAYTHPDPAVGVPLADMLIGYLGLPYEVSDAQIHRAFVVHVRGLEADTAKYKALAEEKGQ